MIALRSALDVGRIRPAVLFDAWLFAEADATLALAAGAPRRATTRPPPTPPTDRPWTVRPRRPGRSSCASRPPEPDLDPPRKQRAWPRSRPPPPQRRRRQRHRPSRASPERFCPAHLPPAVACRAQARPLRSRIPRRARSRPSIRSGESESCRAQPPGKRARLRLTLSAPARLRSSSSADRRLIRPPGGDGRDGPRASAQSVPDHLARLPGGGGCLALDRRDVRHGAAEHDRPVDDELQTIAGTLTDATDLTAGGRRRLDRAADQVTAPRPGSTPWGRRSRPRIDIEVGGPVQAAAPQFGGPRRHCAGRPSSSCEERRPRTEGWGAGGAGRPRSARGSRPAAGVALEARRDGARRHHRIPAAEESAPS